jgi:hypothetical protein
LVTLCGGIINYSDAPLNLTTQPLIVVNGDQQVTTAVPDGGSTK